MYLRVIAIGKQLPKSLKVMSDMKDAEICAKVETDAVPSNVKFQKWCKIDRWTD